MFEEGLPTIKPILGANLRWGHGSTYGLKAYWPFTAAGTLVDFAPHQNHGTLTNSPEWRADALRFDGVDQDAACGSRLLNGWTGLSIVVWINFEVLNGPICSQWFTAGSLQLILRGDGSGFDFFLHDGTSQAGGDFGDIAVSVGEWNQVVATWDGATMRMYLNAKASATTFAFAGPIDVNVAGDDFVWARDRTVFLQGSIRNGLVCDRALSASEIQQLFINQNLLIQQDPIWMGSVALVAGVTIPIMIHHYKQAGGL